MRTLLTLLLAACLAPMGFAQGSVEATLPTNTGNAFDNVLTSFNLTADKYLRIHRFGAASSWVGSGKVEVWIKPGGIGAAPPQQMPLNGWQLAGSAETQFSNAGEIVQIPVDVGHVMQANDKVGVVLIHTSNMKFQHYMWGAGAQPPFANSDLTIDFNSYMGAYNSNAVPTFNSYYSPPAAAYATVWYDTSPTLTPSLTSLALPDAHIGSAGATASYKISGVSLTAETTITAPPGVEISFQPQTGFAQSLTVSTYPNYQAVEVYARFRSNAPGGPISGSIVHSSPGATSKSVSLSGEVLAMWVSTNAISAGYTLQGTPSVPVGYTLTGSTLTTSTTISAPSGFELAKTIGGPYSASLTLTAMSYSQDVFVRLSGTTPGTYSGNIANTSGASSCPIYVSGNVVTPLDLIVERLGPNTTVAVDSNEPGWTELLEFRASTLTSPWTVASMTFSASGTAIPDAAFSQLGLFEDSATAGTPGVFDGPAIDTPAGPFAAAFLSGSATITLNDPAFSATTTRGFFLCGELAGNATAGRTIAVDLTAMNASPSVTGAATIRGMPTTGIAPALQINPARLSFVVHGPEAYTTVLRDSQGPADNGHVICDVSVTSLNYDWTVTSITFAESGTIDAKSGLSFLRLYVDNGNGVWDGPQTDLVAANGTATGFSAPNGEYKAALMPTYTHLGVNQTRRFFLVAKLSGGATPAQTLRVAVIDVDQNSPTQGEVQGVPSATVPALVVELSTLSVSAGPGNPQSFSVLKDAAGWFAIGQFRLTASAGSFVLHGLHLTTGGNGNWVSNIASVEICLDDGDGEFGSGDVILSSDAPTSAGVDCQFFQGLNLAQGTLSDVWVVVTPNPSAGGTPSETFTASVVFESDVAVTPASAFIAQGANLPVTGTLHVVDFAVATFTPAESGLNGGGSIMIRGSGFADPVKLTIGGVLCGGTAIVNASGTEIRGLKVPKGSGQALEIVLQTNGLDPIVLGQTFTYSTIYEVEEKKVEGEGCAVGAPTAPQVALLLLGLGALAVRRKTHGRPRRG